MKKIILLFILVLTVVGVNAKKDRLYASFQQSGNGSRNFTYEGNKFTWTATNNNWMEMFSLTAGDLSNYESLNITITADASNNFNFRLFVNGTDYNNTQVAHGLTAENLTVRIPLSTLKSTGNADIDISKITSIRIAGASSGNNNEYVLIYPADVYLEKADDVERLDITTRVNSAHASSTDPFTWTLDGKTVYSKMGTSQNGVLYGYDSDNSETNSFSVVGYDKAIHRVSAGSESTKIRYLSSSNVETEFFKSTSDISGINYISTIKSNGNLTVDQIDFIKEFKATSTTAFSIAASASSSVAYDRTFTVGQKSTVCLPFALTAAEVTAAGKFYELSSADGTTLYFTQVSTTEAYKPYVFEAATANPFASLSNKAIVASEGATTSYAVGVYTFQGTLVHQNVPNGAYGYNASTGAFSKATSTEVTIDAFRAYITSTSSARSLDLDFGDGTTGIEKVKKNENSDDNIYNLSGHSVSPNYKGIVIKNGKKMIQK